ncbi:hypothetical protein Hanom_Chr05g00463141 [Helianthus anomalus]
MCFGRVVDMVSDPPVLGFQKLCGRIYKFFNSPIFLANVALLPIVSSRAQVRSNGQCWIIVHLFMCSRIIGCKLVLQCVLVEWWIWFLIHLFWGFINFVGGSASFLIVLIFWLMLLFCLLFQVLLSKLQSSSFMYVTYYKVCPLSLLFTENILNVCKTIQVMSFILNLVDFPS